MAKYVPFPLNERDCNFHYVRTKEGPNGWICYYKDAATMQTDPLEAWRTLDKAKFTDTGKALKEWCLELHAKYGHEEMEEVGRPDQSFASDPEANTESPPT